MTNIHKPLVERIRRIVSMRLACDVECMSAVVEDTFRTILAWLDESPQPSGDVVEAVAQTLYEEDDPWCKAWPWPNLQPDQAGPDAYRHLATAAITAYEAVSGVAKMRDDQIKHMVNRFLGWKLPENFHPDNGISFEPVGNKGVPGKEYRRDVAGTNLFDAVQAEAMVRFMVEGLPARTALGEKP